MSRNNEQALIDWAHSYNGYERIADSPERLTAVIRPMADEYDRTGVIPEWAGVDLPSVGRRVFRICCYRFGGQ